MDNWKKLIMNKSKQIIFFGTEDLSAECLKRLIDDGYTIASVVTKPDSKKGRGKELSEPRVKKIAKEHNIPVWQPNNINDIEDDIKNTQNKLGVLVSFGRIIPKSILDLFEPVGIINLHPSLLPKYRGPSPIETAILNGDRTIGISFIKLSKDMDAGPIYYQTTVNVLDKGAEAMYEAISDVGAVKLSEIISKIIKGELSGSNQDNNKATYTKLLSKNDGEINWDKPAKEILRSIKAYELWPKSRTKIAGKDVVIMDAEMIKLQGEPGKVSIDNKELIIYCKVDAIKIHRLLPAGKKEMASEAFLAGYKID